MKSLICYILSMVICLFEGVDIIGSIFKVVDIGLDTFIDSTRETSLFNFTFTGQLIILGISAIILIYGVVCDEEVRRAL